MGKKKGREKRLEEKGKRLRMKTLLDSAQPFFDRWGTKAATFEGAGSAAEALTKKKFAARKNARLASIQQ